MRTLHLCRDPKHVDELRYIGLDADLVTLPFTVQDEHLRRPIYFMQRVWVADDAPFAPIGIYVQRNVKVSLVPYTNTWAN